MRPRMVLEHRFVESAPEELAPNVIYVSVKYATAIHLCCCGCGNEVVTPLSPTDWQLLFDGETISLTPSIGNRGFQCRSHYWIRRSEVVWCPEWSDTDRARQNSSLFRRCWTRWRQRLWGR
jgi:hypothetical protein